MALSDAKFPVEQQFDDDQPIGMTADELGQAIGVWFRAQDRARITVGEAAAAFNVSADKVVEAGKAYSERYFLVEDSPVPLGQRAFDVDGWR